MLAGTVLTEGMGEGHTLWETTNWILGTLPLTSSASQIGHHHYLHLQLEVDEVVGESTCTLYKYIGDTVRSYRAEEDKSISLLFISA